MTSPEESIDTPADAAKTARHGDPLLSTAKGHPEDGTRHGADATQPQEVGEPGGRD